MRLTERQLRSIVNEVLVTEAKKVDPDDAIKQIADAAKTIIKFGPMVADHLKTVGEQAAAAEENGVPDLTSDLEDELDAVDKFAWSLKDVGDTEVALDLSRLSVLPAHVKAIKKAMKASSKKSPRAKEEPYRGGGSWHGDRLPGGRKAPVSKRIRDEQW